MRLIGVIFVALVCLVLLPLWLAAFFIRSARYAVHGGWEDAYRAFADQTNPFTGDPL